MFYIADTQASGGEETPRQNESQSRTTEVVAGCQHQTNGELDTLHSIMLGVNL